MGALRSVEDDIRNPEVKRILTEGDPRGGSAPFSVEEKREAYRKSVIRAGPPEPIHSVEDQAIAGPGGEIPIRVYRPATGNGEYLPIIVYLHGGGMFSGDLHTHDPACRALANHVPAVVVAVNYRLAPENRYPAAVDDCFAVMQWVASHGEALKADSSRICVMGDSAGGNLAAVMALRTREAGEPALAAQVLIYPMLDATLTSTSLIENALIPPFTLVDCVYSWQLYLSPETDRRDPNVSPVLASDLRNLPPALVITSEFDILADEGELYADRLKEAGTHVEHEHYPDMVHGFFQWGGQVAAARVAMNRVVQFVRAHTGRARSSGV